MSNYLPHTAVTVNICGNGGFKNNLGLCINLDKSLFNSFMVAHKSLHTVRLNSINVGKQKNIGSFAMKSAEGRMKSLTG